MDLSMDNAEKKIYKTSEWYQSLADHTFPTSFLKLKKDEKDALAAGEVDGEAGKEVQNRLKIPMNLFPGNCFVFVDTAAPTDTERFETKRGAVHSPASAWRYLCESEKVRSAVKSGESDHICIRPFRRMSQPREFRIFIKDGKLSAMSQYWLIRHYRRLEGRKNFYWDNSKKLVEKINWLLPASTIVMDVYFTSANEILILDFNPWGEPTAPLIMKTWDRDWNKESGINLIPSPIKVSGDVNVSF